MAPQSYSPPRSPALQRELDAMFAGYALLHPLKGGASLADLLTGNATQETLLQTYPNVKEQLGKLPTHYDTLTRTERTVAWAAMSQARTYVLNALKIVGKQRINQEVAKGIIPPEDQVYIFGAALYPLDEFKDEKPEVRKNVIDNLGKAVDAAYEMLKRLPAGSAQKS